MIGRPIRNSKYRRWEAFTLVELLVVIAMIAILMSMLMPAIQSAREAARRTQCTRNLGSIMLALHQYEMAWEAYPMGTSAAAGPIRNAAQDAHHNWLIHLLPHLEQANAYREIDRNVSVYDPANAPVRKLTMPRFMCPSDDVLFKNGQKTHSFSSYAGLHHHIEAPIDTSNSGLFFLNTHIRYDDVTDGSAQTIYFGEKLVDVQRDLGWMSGTSATLRNTGQPPNRTANVNSAGGPAEPQVDAPGVAQSEDGKPADAATDGQPFDPALYVGGFGSSHPTGANFAFGDGDIRFIGDSIDAAIFQQLGHRTDGALLDYEGW